MNDLKTQREALERQLAAVKQAEDRDRWAAGELAKYNDDEQRRLRNYLVRKKFVGHGSDCNCGECD